MDIWVGGLFAGLWGRQNIPLNISSVIMVVGYSSETFRLGYSYDFSVLNTNQGVGNTGAHEVTFSLKFQYKSGQRSRRRAIKFPIF